MKKRDEAVGIIITGILVGLCVHFEVYGMAATLFTIATLSTILDVRR